MSVAALSLEIKSSKKALTEIESLFKITHSKDIGDFIGCKIERDNNQMLLSQPNLIKKMIAQFKEKSRTSDNSKCPHQPQAMLFIVKKMKNNHQKMNKKNTGQESVHSCTS